MSVPFFDHRPQMAPIRHDIEARVKQVFEHGQFILGPEVHELEAALAKNVGLPHCVGASSGTDALLAVLLALDLAPGDEVVTPAFSYVAAAEMLQLLRLKPVYVEVDPDSFNLDPTRLSQALTDNTRAVVAVDLFGQPAQYDAIREVIADRDIVLIEDAAQSLGSSRHGVAAGALADIAITSFFPTKTLGCFGDGGAVFTKSSEMASRVRSILVHGQRQKYQHERIGFNGRLDTVQAAVLLAKLQNFDADLSQRQRAASRYDELVADLLAVFDVHPPLVEAGNTHVYGQYTLTLPQRDAVQSLLGKAGIATAVHYPLPLYRQWGQRPDTEMETTEHLCNSVLSLPLYPGIPPEHQIAVVEALQSALAAGAH